MSASGQDAGAQALNKNTDVVGMFPARDSLIRLVGAVLAEKHDDWIEGRRYLGLDILAAPASTPHATKTPRRRQTP